jgi:hypothetical protein
MLLTYHFCRPTLFIIMKKFLPNLIFSLWVIAQALAQTPGSVIDTDFTKKYGPKTPQIPMPGVQIQSWEEQNRQQNAKVMAEVEAYQAEQARRAKMMAELTTKTADIKYTFTGRNYPGRERFESALQQLAQMGNEGKFDVARAVFITESAVDPSLTWEVFQKIIGRMANHIQIKIQQDKISPDDALGKQLTLLSFFTDTLKVKYPDRAAPVTSYPMLYDFDDYAGKEDMTKLMVAKLMATGSGQCHSLPLLYLILAKEIGVEARLALSPNHTYVKFQDNSGQWHNVELTSHALVSDQFIQNSGYISAEALRNQLFMQPLTERELLGHCMTDLAWYYEGMFGPEPFMQKASSLSLQYTKRSIQPHIMLNAYYIFQIEYIIEQYKQRNLTPQQFELDPKVQKIIAQIEGLQAYIEKVGYREMPPEQYEAWLKSVQNAQNKQQHQQKMRNLMGQIGN